MIQTRSMESEKEVNKVMGNTSSGEKCLNFWTNFRFRVKNNMKIVIILLILHFVSAPLNMINILIYASKEKKAQQFFDLYGYDMPSYENLAFNVWYPAIAMIATFAAVVCGFIVVYSVFNYLYKKQNVDMVLSLPMSSSTRFWSDFTAGIAVYIGPFILNSILTLILSVLGDVLFSDILMNQSEIFHTDTIFTSITSVMLTLIISGIFIMLFLYCLTLIVTVCCGNAFESISYSLLVNGLIPATVAIGAYILFGNLRGIDYGTTMLPVITATSPGGTIAGYFLMASEGGTLWQFIKYLLPILIISSVLAVGAYFLYKYRKAESTSKPFVYKTLYYIIITSVTFCIGGLMMMDIGDPAEFSSQLIPFIIITAIIYLIFEIITNRGFKKFWKSVIKYLITIASVIAVIFLCRSTGGFGLEKYVPSESSVKNITFTSYNTGTSVISDDENIKRIIDIHKTIINTSDKGYNGNSGVSVSLEYRLKNGRKIIRNYYVDINKIPQITELESNVNYMLGKIDAIFSERFYWRNCSLLISDYTNFIASNDLNYNRSLFAAITEYRDTEYSADIKNFFSALKKDIKENSDDGKMTLNKKPLYTVCFATNSNYILNDTVFYIYDDYKNVLSFIKNKNITVPAMHIESKDVYNSEMSVLTSDLLKVKLDDSKVIYTDLLIEKNYDDKNFFIGSTVFDTDKQVEIIKNLIPFSVSDKPVNAVVYNGKIYALPDSKLYLISDQITAVENEKKNLKSIYKYGGGSGVINIKENYSYDTLSFEDEDTYVNQLFKSIYLYNAENGYFNKINYDSGKSEVLNNGSGCIYSMLGTFNFADYNSFCRTYKDIYDRGYAIDGIYFSMYGINVNYYDTEPVLDYNRYYEYENRTGGIICTVSGNTWEFYDYHSYVDVTDQIYKNGEIIEYVAYNNGAYIEYEDRIPVMDYDRYYDGISHTYNNGYVYDGDERAADYEPDYEMASLR